MKKWTQAQAQAISQKGSVLVSASAGTGKTAVLTEKVVNEIVNNRINIDDMVIMTFSSAAAAQMKERIKKRIQEVAEEVSDRNTKNFLYGQMRRFHNAHIQTIHSFCGELIRKYFYVIGADPNMKVADAIDVALMKMRIAEKVTEPEYAEMENSFVTLEELTDGTETIESVIIGTYEKIIPFVDYMKWLEQAVNQYDIGDEIPEFMLDTVISDFEDAFEYYEKAIQLIEDKEDVKFQKILDVLYFDRNLLYEVIKGLKTKDKKYIETLPDMLDKFGETVRFPSGELENAKALRNTARDIIQGKYVKTYFSFDAQCERIRNMYQPMKKFLQLMQRFDEMYIAEKRRCKVIDFNDMEKMAYQILRDNAISDECRKIYLRVFIDEYQDTNPIQEEIISRISTSENLFCVGDLKQSIYRFRSSDPTLFMQRSRNYQNNVNLGSIVSLNSNFRSAQNILCCANDVFNHITRVSSEIDYTDNDALVHGRSDDMSMTPMEVEIIPNDLRGTDGLSMDEIEACNIADIITRNVGKPIFDSETGETREARYSDIVVLSRKLSGITDALAQVLHANNIPYVIERSGQLLETMEIMVLMNIVSLINHPKNDMKLISIMHVGLFGFTDSDIIEIRNKDAGSYFNYMSSTSDGTVLADKCRRLFSFLDDCREKQKYLSLTAVLNHIISTLNLNDIFAVMRNGAQKVANIKEFMRYAHEFEDKSSQKLFGFEQYIEDIKRAGVSIGEAVMNLDENSVHITTIHKSKGLEYPIVILAFAGKEFNRMDKKASIVVDKDTGIGVKYYNHDKKEKGKNVLRSCIEDTIDAKNVEEEMRLLYVAMTRAKEKLYVQGTSKPNAEYADLDEAGCFLDWIMSTAANSVDFADRYNGDRSLKLSGKWEIRTVDYADIAGYASSEATETNIGEMNRLFCVCPSGEKEEKTHDKEYVPLVMSASMGNHNDVISTSALSKPDFMKEGKDSLYVGTVVHDFLKKADLSECLTEEGIRKQKENMSAAGVMDSDDLKNVDEVKLAKFFATPLGMFIAKADSHIKEKYIGIIVDAKELGYSENEDILVRCIIDLLCVKDGKYYLVDYKTDKIYRPEDEAEVRDKAYAHKPQLDMYRNALMDMYGISVERMYIAFVNYASYYDITD